VENGGGEDGGAEVERYCASELPCKMECGGKVYTHEMRACEVHAHETPAHQMHACKTHTREVQINHKRPHTGGRLSRPELQNASFCAKR
jgi:hypothetical protein